MDFTEILSAESPSEILALTQSTNLAEAENKVLSEYELSTQSRKSFIIRFFSAVLGVLLIYVSWRFLLLPLFLIGLYFIFHAFFIKKFGKRQIHKHFVRIQNDIKQLDGFPELIIEKSIATLIPQSALGSQVAKIKDAGKLFLNTDSTKHLWNHAGFCRVATGRSTKDHADWQYYYIFAYQFHGRVPQTVMLHTHDRFVLPTSPDNKVISNLSPSWKIVVAEQYEIESLAILTQETISKLNDLVKNDQACTIEFFESQLLCFIPVDSPSTSALFSFEKIADDFARVLLPKLEGTELAMIGNIQPVLALDIELKEGNKVMTKSEHRRRNWILIVIVLFFFTFAWGLWTLKTADSIIFPYTLLPFIPIPFFILIVFLMPKKIRSEWLRGSGLRINGRRVTIRRKKK
jgi:hypothetical protein